MNAHAIVVLVVRVANVKYFYFNPEQINAAEHASRSTAASPSTPPLILAIKCEHAIARIRILTGVLKDNIMHRNAFRPGTWLCADVFVPPCRR